MKEPKNYYQNILLASSSQKVIDNAVLQTLPGDFHFGPHMHSTVELFICLEGQCTMTISQTPVELKREDYIAILSNHPHSCDTPLGEGCVILQLHFHPDIFMNLFSDTLNENLLFFLMDLTLGQKKYIKGICSQQLYSCLHFIREELDQRGTNYQKMVDLYFAQLLILVSRDISNTVSSNSIQSNRHLLSAFEYINQHYAEKITVEKLAEYCGISSRFLSQLFNKHLGMNISTYITYFRINKSIELMSAVDTPYPLTQLALDVGFGSLQHYSKVFKETMNISPTKYFFRK